jgi:hypothetical protein
MGGFMPSMLEEILNYFDLNARTKKAIESMKNDKEHHTAYDSPDPHIETFRQEISGTSRIKGRSMPANISYRNYARVSPSNRRALVKPVVSGENATALKPSTAKKAAASLGKIR